MYHNLYNLTKMPPVSGYRGENYSELMPYYASVDRIGRYHMENIDTTLSGDISMPDLPNKVDVNNVLKLEEPVNQAQRNTYYAGAGILAVLSAMMFKG
ncbi:MAG: hypothetical protein ACOVNU_11465 [Candidatus Kapaibacteriota bacterium]|jgi:hypothetical protein